LLQLVRKPGTGRASARSYANAGAGVDVVGLVAVTGLPETWLMEMHGSFASIEALDRGLSAVEPARAADTSDPVGDDVLAPARTMIAAYRQGWSYRPVDAVRLFPRARYFLVTVYRIRAGAEADFGELVRIRRAAADAANLDRPELTYQVVSGAPGGTYFFLAPLVSLTTLDNGMGPLPVYAEGLAAARAEQGSKIAAEAEISRERLLFRVDPRISYVSAGFAGADAAFWHGKAKRQ